ncbi:hypothetical protein MUU48_18275 [Scandinavium sp. H11S7]|uniref:Uncharacterized protein n=1 Tax=Scandinavium hiltneri TaxID=2926519 RepID=A0ABT2DYA3_9ENTR|nr:hypothetical protein [Scandinavium hiltneri]MCS2158836.1 hypothetical protein [Scandinavium hiltneri]MCS2160606.1 hypothetical protein [Scandinavium hiltneri]
MPNLRCALAPARFTYEIVSLFLNGIRHKTIIRHPQVRLGYARHKFEGAEMIEWEDESVATQDELTKRLIDTVAAVVLVVIVVAGLFFA